MKQNTNKITVRLTCADSVGKLITYSLMSYLLSQSRPVNSFMLLNKAVRLNKPFTDRVNKQKK